MFDKADQTRVVCRMPGVGAGVTSRREMGKREMGKGDDDKELEEEEMKLEVEIVVLRDGRGEVVTVT